MLSAVARWLGPKWIHRNDAGERATLDAYAACFNTLQGQLVLQHLLDTVYCTVYEGSDAAGLAAHNGKRAVVQSILENIDYASNPAKYLIGETSNGVVR